MKLTSNGFFVSQVQIVEHRKTKRAKTFSIKGVKLFNLHYFFDARSYI